MAGEAVVAVVAEHDFNLKVLALGPLEGWEAEINLILLVNGFIFFLTEIN